MVTGVLLRSYSELRRLLFLSTTMRLMSPGKVISGNAQCGRKSTTNTSTKNSATTMAR